VGRTGFQDPYLMKPWLVMIEVRVFMEIKLLSSRFHDGEDAIFIVEVIVIVVVVVFPFLRLLQ
jgi:hypothetical protein